MPDSTKDTQEHIVKVYTRMMEVMHRLALRAGTHDASKLEEPEKSGYDKLTAVMAGLTYGTDAYKTAMASVMADPVVKAAWEHHYQHNSHHVEHFEHGIAGMSLLDLVEMICDWKGASERNGPSKLTLDYSVKRHGIDPQLAAILENTVKELGW